ncbi:oxygenase MpaB family protein [Streptomyces sp. NPDC002577]
MERQASSQKSPAKSGKWIRRRIEELDPETDYAEIYRLSTTYYGTPMLGNFQFWFHVFHFVTSERTAQAIFRNDDGAFLNKSDRRSSDTMGHLVSWYEHGPGSPVTEVSVGVVNKLHQHWAKQYPDALNRIEDYIYVCAYFATFHHRILATLGLPGWSPKQKAAAVKVWNELSESFTLGDGRLMTEVTSELPRTFEEMERIVDDYLGQDVGANPTGSKFAHIALDRYAETWFPRPLLPIGRAMITCTLHPQVMKTFQLKQPSPIARRLGRWALKANFLPEVLLPDPKISVPDRMRVTAAKKGDISNAVDVNAHRIAFARAGADPATGLPTGCPAHAVVAMARKSGKAVEDVEIPL